MPTRTERTVSINHYALDCVVIGKNAKQVRPQLFSVTDIYSQILGYMIIDGIKLNWPNE